MVAKSLSEQLKGRRPRLRNREDAELHVGVLFWVFSFFVLLRLLFLSIFLCAFLPQDLRGWWAWCWLPKSGPASRWPCGPGWSTAWSWCPSRWSPLRLLPRLALTWHGTLFRCASISWFEVVSRWVIDIFTASASTGRSIIFFLKDKGSLTCFTIYEIFKQYWWYCLHPNIANQ